MNAKLAARIGSTAALLLIGVAWAGCSVEPTDAPGDAGRDTTPGAAGERCNPDSIGVDTRAGASIDGCDLYTECVRGVCRPIVDESIPCRDVGPVVELPELWTELALASSPPGRSRHSAVYDAANDRLIVFGGSRDADTYLNDTWVLAGATDLEGGASWTELEPTGGPPPPRDNHAAVYDAANNRMIIHGGGDGSITRNDSWVLSNANGLGGDPVWTELVAGNAPYRGSAVAAYVAADNALVLFAGYEGYNHPNEVWLLGNANGLDEPASWSRLDVASPPPGRAYSAGAFDAATGTMLFYGGDAADSTPTQPRFLDDTWSMALASSASPTFRAVNVSSSPGRRAHHSLVYDPMTQRAILFAGAAEDGFAHSDVHILWTGRGATWATYATGNAPPDRVGHRAGYSPRANRMVVFGGEVGDTHFDDTWVLDRANGDASGSIVGLEIRAAQTSLCRGRKMALTAIATTEDGELSVPVVWECSRPAVVSSDGVVSASAAGIVTCTACAPDGELCSDPFEIEITAPVSPPTGGGGDACENGFFYATQRTCTVLDGPGCTCDDFPCNACIPSADFPDAEGHALAEGEHGCVDGDTGAIVKPCAPGLCCLVGGACGNPMGGSYCGECPAEFACP